MCESSFHIYISTQKIFLGPGARGPSFSLTIYVHTCRFIGLVCCSFSTARNFYAYWVHVNKFKKDLFPSLLPDATIPVQQAAAVRPVSANPANIRRVWSMCGSPRNFGMCTVHFAAINCRKFIYLNKCLLQYIINMCKIYVHSKRVRA